MAGKRNKTALPRMTIETTTSPRLTKRNAYTRAGHFARYHLAALTFDQSQSEGGGDTPRVLDIGCGVGYGSALLANRGYQVLGFDPEPEAIAAARAQFGPASKRLEFRQTTIEALADDPPGLFDAATFFEVIEHLELKSTRRSLDRLTRLLKPHAVVCLSTPDARYYGGHSGNPYHLHEYDPSELRDLLEKFFVSVTLKVVRPPSGWEDYNERYLRQRARRNAQGALSRTFHHWIEQLNPRRKRRDWLDYRGFELRPFDADAPPKPFVWADCRSPLPTPGTINQTQGDAASA